MPCNIIVHNSESRAIFVNWTFLCKSRCKLDGDCIPIQASKIILFQIFSVIDQNKEMAFHPFVNFGAF